MTTLDSDGPTSTSQDERLTTSLRLSESQTCTLYLEPYSLGMLKEGLLAFGAIKKYFQLKSNDLRKILPNFLAEFLRRRTGHFRLPSVIKAQVKAHLSDHCEFYQSPDPQSGSHSALYTGPRRVGCIGVTVQHGPRSTIDLDLCALPPRFPGVLGMTAVANIEKLTECTIVLRLPWCLDKTVMFETFYDADCFGRESVELHNGTSDFDISLGLPQAIATLQEVRGHDWGRVTIVAMLKVDYYSCAAIRFVNAAIGPAESMTHIWICFQFVMERDPGQSNGGISSSH